MNIRWDAERYTNSFSFVHQYGEAVLELITPPPAREDDWTATFRIVGQTQDRLIGRMNMDNDYVWVSKEDFLAGNANYHKFMSV